MTSRSVISDWVEMAEEQGWMVIETKNGHLQWRSPANQYIHTNGPRSGGSHQTSRALLNAKKELQRAGLCFPEVNRKQPAPEETEGEEEMQRNVIINDSLPPPKIHIMPMTLDHLAEMNDAVRDDIDSARNALSAAVEMIEELADQFATFRTATTDSLQELRGKVMKLAVAPDLSKYATKAELSGELSAYATTEELSELEKKLTDQLAKVDPIASFRARLNK